MLDQDATFFLGPAGRRGLEGFGAQQEEALVHMGQAAVGQAEIDDAAGDYALPLTLTPQP